MSSKDIYQDFESGTGNELEVKFYVPMLEDNVGINSRIWNKFVQLNIGRYIGEERTIVTSYGDVRSIEYTTGKIEYEKKTRVGNSVVDPNYKWKTTLSKEKSVSGPTEDKTGTRIRDRKSWVLFPGRIDASKVINEYFDKKGSKITRTTYEIEYEYVGERSNLKLFRENLFKIYSMIFVGEFKPYDCYDLSPVVQKVNGLHKILPKPRNIKKEDLEFGGIVGNIEMFVTVKADGVRYILVVSGNKLWLTFPSLEFYFYEQINHRSWDDSMFDGEFVTLKNGQPQFIIFDCLRASGRDMTKTDYSLRLTYARRFVRSFAGEATGKQDPRNKGIWDGFVSCKETYALSEMNYYRLLRKMMVKRFSETFKQDGLIFIPNTVYNSGSEVHNLSERILTQYPDICKWKDPENLTVDFEVRQDGYDRTFLNVWDGTKSVPFRGNLKYPFQNPVQGLSDIPDGIIAEFSLSGHPRFVRARPDKTGSNTQTVANSVWNDVIDPIDEKYILGLTLSTVYTDFGMMKRAAFDYLRDKDAKNVIDIGSGRGGDLWKMDGLKVLFVEPNSRNAAELEERMKKIPDHQRKYRVLKFGGEDKRLPFEASKWFGNVRADAVTMMLSLSFFWKSPEMLDALVRNISETVDLGGYFAYMTIDGDFLESELDNGYLNILDAIYEVSGENVKVTMPGTIVETQREWLVRTVDLKARLIKEGFELFSYTPCDAKRLRSPEQLQFSRLYSMGIYKRMSRPGWTGWKGDGRIDAESVLDIINGNTPKPRKPKPRKPIPDWNVTVTEGRDAM